MGTHERVFCRFAVPDETGTRGGEDGEHGGWAPSGPTAAGAERETHLALASLTLIRGRARSSLSRWLCSVRRRSLSSDMDCLCGREFMVQDGTGSRTLRQGVWCDVRGRWRRERRGEKVMTKGGKGAEGGSEGVLAGGRGWRCGAR